MIWVELFFYECFCQNQDTQDSVLQPILFISRNTADPKIMFPAYILLS